MIIIMLFYYLISLNILYIEGKIIIIIIIIISFLFNLIDYFIKYLKIKRN